MSEEPTLDPHQEQIWQEVNSTCNQLQTKKISKLSLLLHNFGISRPPPELPKGVFLYGSVGSGKTLIMRRFAGSADCRTKLVHFQDFMQQMHNRMHKIQQEAPNTDKVMILAKELASQYDALCLDEFEIKDITDAMLARQLFAKLADNRVFIFLTSNTQPLNLYKDGLKRELFLPFIEMVNTSYKILALDSPIDYRSKNKASNLQKIFLLTNQDAKTKLNKAIEDLLDGRDTGSKAIELFGRSLEFNTTCEEILLTNFAELCQKNLSYIDFVAIAENFEVIILEDVPQISEDQTDIAIRFINLIDNLYFQHKTIFISIKVPLSEIYPNGHRAKEFNRTVSRLQEMASNSY